ncbi:MAG: RNA polymerase sigma factor [Labilithrix sp.]|nr:RNA polymerase sigma factor [Labilithrix sp.]MBX3225156.1 RNA polymerase sigma factor [Labilithrix sp.]
MSRSRTDERQQVVAEAHFASVWRFLRALGVPAGALDDAAQEVFLVVAKKLAQIRPGAERAFLFSTAVNVSRELRRKHAREELAQDPDDEALEPADDWTPEASLDRKEERDLLMHLLDGLSDELRTVLVLYEIEGHVLPEIAAMLDIPIGTAASRLRRAREKVEVRLQKLQRTMGGER